MTNDEYTSMVDSGNWPDDIIVPLDEPFTDERGAIQNLLLKPSNSVTVITSKARTLRANHYHKTDWHYSYVVSGEIKYFHRKVGSDSKKVVTMKPGTMFFTPPMVEHCMAFTEDTTFITMARNVRSHESHESDVVRVDFVSHSDVDW